MQFSKQDIPNLNIAGKVVGITSGCFDLLHFYHFRFLERCKAQCDFLIVGVDSDMLVYQNKNKVPMIPEHHRMAMVDALKCVDATFRMDSISDIDEFAVATSATKMFKNLPTIYGNEVKPPIGVNLILIPDIEEVSSTSALIEKIRSVSQTASLTNKPSKMNKREIKFRGKRIDNGNWAYGYYVSIAGTHKIVSFNPDSPSFATYYDVDSSTVGQCTGLIDRNGKEVFEGDIVEYKNNIGIVTYYEGRGQFQIKVKGQPPITMHNKKGVIVDNIHDNTGKQKEDKQA